MAARKRERCDQRSGFVPVIRVPRFRAAEGRRTGATARNCRRPLSALHDLTECDGEKRAGMDTLAFERPPAEPGQVGLRARFIQKDQFGRVKARRTFAPEAARPRDVWTVLLAGPERLLYMSVPSSQTRR